MGEDRSPLGRYSFNRCGSSCSEPWGDLVQQGKGWSALNYPHPGQSKIETAASVMSNEVKKPDKKVHSNYGVILKP